MPYMQHPCALLINNEDKMPDASLLFVTLFILLCHEGGYFTLGPILEVCTQN